MKHGLHLSASFLLASACAAEPESTTEANLSGVCGDIELVGGIGQVTGTFENGGPILSFSNAGRYLGLVSLDANLAPGDTNNEEDVYLYDVETRTFEWISQGFFGATPNDASTHPSVNGDGQIVAFHSRATNLVASDTNGDDIDVFVRDLAAGTTTLVSVDDAGAQGQFWSGAPAIDESGQIVAFHSHNTFQEEPSDNVLDVFVRDLTAGTTDLISVEPGGAQLTRHASDPIISFDGRYVAFQAERICGAAAREILVHDRQLGVTIDPIPGNPCPFSDKLDASIVSTYNLRARDFGNYGAYQVSADFLGVGRFSFNVLETATGQKLEASADANGVSGDLQNRYGAIDPGGINIAFWSNATNLVPNPPAGFNVYVLTNPFECSSGDVCGDGTQGSTEGCDDGNTAGGDGCSALCVVEADAAFDAQLGTPACSGAVAACDTQQLIDGRANVGPEQNQPNTLDGCADGTSGSYHADESLDRLRIETVDGGALAAGADVRIDATVWAWGNGTSDHLDIYHAADANSPSWQLLTTISGEQGGGQVLTAYAQLPAGGSGLQAIRAQWRYSGVAQPCTGGGYDDRDDLVFEAAPGAPGVGPQNANYSAFGAPACLVAATSCDTVNLVVGRGSVGPETNAPNTTDGCVDGDAGSFHSDESIDRLVISTVSGDAFAAGEVVRIEATVWAYGSGSSDFLDLYYLPESGGPWQLISTQSGISSGEQTLSADFTLPTDGSVNRTFRAQWRYGGSGADACSPGVYNDRDDLIIVTP